MRRVLVSSSSHVWPLTRLRRPSTGKSTTLKSGLSSFRASWSYGSKLTPFQISNSSRRQRYVSIYFIFHVAYRCCGAPVRRPRPHMDAPVVSSYELRSGAPVRRSPVVDSASSRSLHNYDVFSRRFLGSLLGLSPKANCTSHCVVELSIAKTCFCHSRQIALVELLV